nr:MAG TPA: hypothetical protein [Caudoviricetes sp.]
MTASCLASSVIMGREAPDAFLQISFQTEGVFILARNS